MEKTLIDQACREKITKYVASQQEAAFANDVFGDQRVHSDQLVNKDKQKHFMCSVCLQLLHNPVSCASCEALLCS